MLLRFQSQSDRACRNRIDGGADAIGAPRAPRCLAFVLAVTLAAGCSSAKSAGDTMTGWFGSSSVSEGRAAYAGPQGAAVVAEPGSSSKQVGRLRAGEKVVRTRDKDGFVYIEARGGALKGWVPKAKLVSRAPHGASTGKAADGARPPAGSEPASPDEAEAPDSAPDAASEEPDSPAAEPVSASVPVEAEKPEPPSSRPPANRGEAPAKAKGVGASVLDPY